MVFFLRVIAPSPQVLSNDALYCGTVNFGRRIQRARRTIGSKNTRVKKKKVGCAAIALCARRVKMGI
jgi:hypothetical protein